MPKCGQKVTFLGGSITAKDDKKRFVARVQKCARIHGKESTVDRAYGENKKQAHEGRLAKTRALARKV